MTGQRISRINSDQGAATWNSERAGSSNIMTSRSVVMVETHTATGIYNIIISSNGGTQQGIAAISWPARSVTVAGTMESAIGNRTVHK